MKHLFTILFLCFFVCVGTMAQTDADKIVGNWLLDYNGKQTKVKVFKVGNGYRAQNYWVRETKNADGSLKYDVKNPDKTKRSIPVSKIVLIDKVVYDDDEWNDGKIYDPTSGRSYTVTIKLKDANTLSVKGSVLGIGKTIYWKRIKE